MGDNLPFPQACYKDGISKQRGIFIQISHAKGLAPYSPLNIFFLDVTLIHCMVMVMPPSGTRGTIEANPYKVHQLTPPQSHRAWETLPSTLMV